MTTNNNDIIINIDIEEEFGQNTKKSQGQSMVCTVMKAFGMMAVGMMVLFGTINYYQSGQSSAIDQGRNILMQGKSINCLRAIVPNFLRRFTKDPIILTGVNGEESVQDLDEVSFGEDLISGSERKAAKIQEEADIDLGEDRLAKDLFDGIDEECLKSADDNLREMEVNRAKEGGENLILAQHQIAVLEMHFTEFAKGNERMNDDQFQEFVEEKSGVRRALPAAAAASEKWCAEKMDEFRQKKIRFGWNHNIDLAEFKAMCRSMKID